MLKRVACGQTSIKWHMCVDKLFDISRKDIDKQLSAEDYLLIKDQKGPRTSTFAGEDQ